jgi:hypothetical protein
MSINNDDVIIDESVIVCCNDDESVQQFIKRYTNAKTLRYQLNDAAKVLSGLIGSESVNEMRRLIPEMGTGKTQIIEMRMKWDDVINKLGMSSNRRYRSCKGVQLLLQALCIYSPLIDSVTRMKPNISPATDDGVHSIHNCLPSTLQWIGKLSNDDAIHNPLAMWWKDFYCQLPSLSISMKSTRQTGKRPMMDPKSIRRCTTFLSNILTICLPGHTNASQFTSITHKQVLDAQATKYVQQQPVVEKRIRHYGKSTCVLKPMVPEDYIYITVTYCGLNI